MKKDFEQLSIKQGFMKHNGGLFYRQISETESEFKASVNEYHLNAAGITHGGYIALIIDAGAVLEHIELRMENHVLQFH
jgi:acyl-coenzyme A thioesterase PaaI-like protein